MFSVSEARHKPNQTNLRSETLMRFKLLVNNNLEDTFKFFFKISIDTDQWTRFNRVENNETK